MPGQIDAVQGRPKASAVAEMIHNRRILLAFGLVSAALGFHSYAAAQITIDTKTGTVSNSTTGKAGTVDRRYEQIKPTNIPLKNTNLDPRTRQDLLRLMQSEQGFAMRPLPRGHRGLTLVANGPLVPAGEEYLQMVTSDGLSVKPGDRVVLTDVKIDHNKIVFDINGGPDHKHAFLRHIQLGTGPVMNPVVQSDDPEPTGARLTLAFKKDIPELTGTEVKALLAPLISFDVKTPVQAFTDTLPTKLKTAILEHHVLVGMSTDMVLYAMGQPDNKTREMDGQMPFEEWIYGKPPKDVQFVRINGNRVIRLEVAKLGESPVIFTKDEVEGLMRTDGTPLEASNTHTVKSGDAERDPNKEAPAAPPTLVGPGEKPPALEQDSSGRVGPMRPVQFPKQKSDDSSQGDGSQSPSQPANGAGQPASGTGSGQAPSNGQQPNAAPSGSIPPASGTPPSNAPATQPANVQPPPVDASQPGPAKPQEITGANQPQ
jgi:hypothetical protein